MMSKKLIVGIGHQSGVGKDTLANQLVHLAQGRRIRAEKVAFADTLKEFTWKLFYYTGANTKLHYEIYRDKRTDKLNLPGDPDIVDLWIKFGQSMRAIDPMIWVEHTLRKVNCSYSDLVVISDVRFTNELEALEKRNSKTVRVLRDNQTVRASDRSVPHDWEWDHVIYNNGTIQDLEQKASALLDAWYGAENEVVIPTDFIPTDPV